MSSQTQRAPSAFFTSRVRDLAPSPTLAVSDRARQLKAQGIDVIDLGGGDPDFITPEHIRAAATEAMNAGDTHYVASAGIPSSAQGDCRQASHRQWNRGRSQRRASSSPRAENKRSSKRRLPLSSPAST